MKCGLVFALELPSMTRSVFPKTEQILDLSEFQLIVSVFFGKKTIGKYRSLADALFCETFTKWKESCFDFYRDKAPPLRDIVSAKQLKKYDRVLGKKLVWMYLIHQQEEEVN